MMRTEIAIVARTIARKRGIVTADAVEVGAAAAKSNLLQHERAAATIHSPCVSTRDETV